MIERAGTGLGRVAVHPLLLAAALVLLLWTTNIGKVSPALALPVLVQALLVALVLWVAARWVTRDGRTAALVASLAVVVALGHGMLWGTGPIARWVGLPVALGLVVVAAVRTRSLEAAAVTRLTAALNVLAVIAVSVGAALIAVTGSTASARPIGPPPVPGEVAAHRDIVWIVPDRYGGAAALDTAFGIGETTLTAGLRQRGFAVAADARANYPRTTHSLAAQLNLDYLDAAVAGLPPAAGAALTPIHPLLRDHATGRLLTDLGYRYTHLGTWWDPTAEAEAADEVVRFDTRSEFAALAEELSILSALGVSSRGTPVDRRELRREMSNHQLDELERVARQLADDTTDAPRLVVAHIGLPHPPYVFDRDGSFVTADEQASRSQGENYARQLAHLDERLLEIIDLLVADGGGDDGPVVLVLADEGPHPERLGAAGESWGWAAATDDELVTKLSILAAVRVPGGTDSSALPAGVTGVNVARLAVGAALGVDLPPLQDRSYVNLEADDLHTFTDVTQRVDAAIADWSGP